MSYSPDDGDHSPTTRPLTKVVGTPWLWLGTLVLALGVGGLLGATYRDRTTTVDIVESPSPVLPTSATTVIGAGEAVEEGASSRAAAETTTTTISPDTDPLTLYVSPQGSDANDGQTPETPLATLPAAIDALQTGMTLFVMEGEYAVAGEGPTLVSLTREGSEEAWTRIVGYGETRPVIVVRGGTLFEVFGSFVEISGLELRGEGFDANASYGYGILLADGHHYRVTDMVVSGFPVGGIGAVRTSHIYVADNTVFENSYWGTEQGSGLSVYQATNYGYGDDQYGYSDYFVNNVVYANENRVTSRVVEGVITDGNGIIVDTNDDTGYIGRTLVANNVVFGNGGRAIMTFHSSRVDIFNNTTFGNVRTGDALVGGRAEIALANGRDVRIMNNIAWNNNGMATYLVDNVDVRFETNAAYGGPLVGHDGGGIEELARPPAFTNPTIAGDADFSLVEGSPLIDGGSATESPLTVDHLGAARIVGPAVDLGAFEFAGL